MWPLLALTLAAPPATQPNQPSADVRPVSPEIVAARVTVPPRIDGVLDDSAWTGPEVPTGVWESYNPLNGATVPQRTRVWVTYDGDALYFAFDCQDDEPTGIKSSVARRDNLGGDDWVGLSLDALGSGQLSYHMMVNPHGAQLDLLNSVAGDEDVSVDWVWDSAGRRTPTGYEVEIRVPLRSIRFTSGHDVRMGLLFWRRVSRLGMSVAWPAIDAGRWVFETHAGLVLSDLEPRLARDITPSVTLSQRQSRQPGGTWGALHSVGELGLSAKVGVGSTAILDVTANPDFSQVESDAFQVEVNQRFPVFYTEKRPFFMEGAGLFSLAGSGGDNSLQRAVHTRRIVNPVAGVKFTGSVGRTTVATLSAVDDRIESKALYNVGRAQMSLGPSNYVGALVTDVEGDGRANRVLGADTALRLSNTQRVWAAFLVSQTRDDDVIDSGRGVGASAGYRYATREVVVSGSFEHYDRGFQMDTALINRVGTTGGWGFGERNFYPRGRWEWVRRVAAFSFLQAGKDYIGRGNDVMITSGVRVNLTRQGFLRVDRTWGFEPWAGERFSRGRLRGFGNVQLTQWVRIEARVETGRAVFYDSVDPFSGRSRRVAGRLLLQPSGRLSQDLSFDHLAFDRSSTGERVFTVDIVNAKTTYQFTRRLQARGLARYDSSKSRLLTDFLLSYEVNPGSIAYIGYGGLFERWVDGPTASLSEFSDRRFAMVERGLLLKVSYLKRF